MSVIVGDGGLIPAFSDALIGMSAGDTKTLHLEAAKGYGEYNPDAIVELPKETFPQCHLCYWGYLVLPTADRSHY